MTVPLPPAGDTSWYDWAQFLHEAVGALSAALTTRVAGDGIVNIETMSLEEWAALADRPATTLYLLPGAGVRLGSVDIATGTSTPEAPDPDPAPDLAAPQNLVGQAVGFRQIQLTWDPATDATSYEVFESRSGWVTPVAVVTEPSRTSGQLGITDPLYTYRVKARTADGRVSDFSQSVTVSIEEVVTGDSTPPTVPAGLVATPMGSSSVSLSWSASTDNVGVTGYQVRRGLATVATAVSGTSYGDSALNPSTAYEYAVRAFDAAGNYSAWSTSATATTPAGTTTPPPTGGGSAFTLFTDSQIGSFSTTDGAALRTKAIADMVKAGTAPNDLSDVNNKVGPTALCAVLWWARTGDASYLAPAKAYILAAPKAPSSVQALNYWRGMGGVFAAVEILKRRGQWSDSATITGSYGGTWSAFANGFETRSDYKGNGRWSVLNVCADDSANNWGTVANFCRAALAGARGDTTLGARAANRCAKYLGEQVAGVDDFNSTNNYIASWDNWMPGNGNGAGSKLKSGIGKRDARLGLDGVVINDIDRGGTGYNADSTYYGATASGLTYPLEAADYVWPTAALLLNAGYPVRSWGDDGFDRMNERFARVAPGGGQSMFDYTEGAYSVYRSGKWMAAKLSQASYGSPVATASGVGGLSRSVPYGDWIAGPGSTWGV